MIEVVGLHKAFGHKQVLRGATLRIERGESVVVIGGSGVGKSVLIKHIIGLLRPDRGKVLVEGQEVAALPEGRLNELRKKFGMLFQGGALFDSMTVGENVGFPLREHTRMSRAEIAAKVGEKLEIVGLDGVEELMPSELSGGMKKRVALARAIAMEPEILLYDEPTTGLDPVMADVINDLIIDMKRRLHITSIAITHDMVSAYKIADRIAMLHDGVIIEEGSPEQIRSSSHPLVRQFVSIGRAQEQARPQL